MTWPTKEETIRYSALVTVVCIATAAFFATLDFSFRAGLDSLVTATRPEITNQEAQTQGQPVTPDVQPFAPDANGGVEAVDEFGNPTDVNVESLPIDAIPDNSFTVTPETPPEATQ